MKLVEPSPEEAAELQKIRAALQGSLATGGATAERLGPLGVYDGLGFKIDGAFHHASDEILQQAAEAWNEKYLGKP